MTLADDVRLVVSHTATVMAMEKSRAHSLGSTIARIDGTSDIVHLEVTSLTPLLDGEVLNVDMARTSRRLSLIDHGNCSLVVHV